MAAFDMAAIMKALDNQGYVSPQDAQANQFGVAGGLQGILAALAQQGYRPPQAGAQQPNMFGIPGGINAITDAVAGQGQFGPAAQNQSWGFNGGTGKYVPAPYGNMGLGNGVYRGGMDSAHGQTAIGPPQVFSAPQSAPTPKPGELPRAPGTMWGGGFGMSDNSAWGNKGDAALLSRSGVGGSLKDTTGQASKMGGQVNATLPGAGSAFGLGGRL